MSVTVKTVCGRYAHLQESCSTVRGTFMVVHDFTLTLNVRKSSGINAEAVYKCIISSEVFGGRGWIVLQPNVLDCRYFHSIRCHIYLPTLFIPQQKCISYSTLTCLFSHQFSIHSYNLLNVSNFQSPWIFLSRFRLFFLHLMLLHKSGFQNPRDSVHFPIYLLQPGWRPTRPTELCFHSR